MQFCYSGIRICFFKIVYVEIIGIFIKVWTPWDSWFINSKLKSSRYNVSRRASIFVNPVPYVIDELSNGAPLFLISI